MAYILFESAALLWALGCLVTEDSDITIAAMFVAVGGLFMGGITSVERNIGIAIAIVTLVVVLISLFKNR